MEEALAGQGFWVILVGATAIVFARSQATYWIARGAVAGAGSLRWGRWLKGPKAERASDLLRRYGPPIVTLSYFTIGFKSVMNAVAGASRMRWWVFTLAMLPGCALYGVIYATVGLAAIWAAITSPWGFGALLLVLAALGAFWWCTARRRAAASAPEYMAPGAPPPAPPSLES